PLGISMGARGGQAADARGDADPRQLRGRAARRARVGRSPPAAGCARGAPRAAPGGLPGALGEPLGRGAPAGPRSSAPRSAAWTAARSTTPPGAASTYTRTGE